MAVTKISMPGGRHLLRAGAAFAVLWSCSNAAHAQTGQQSLSASGQTFGVPARELEANVAADAIYDSNVLRSRSNTQALRGLAKEDVILRPRVEGLVALPAGPVQLMLSGLVGYDIYTRNSELNRERIDLRASAAGGLPGCGAALSGAYSRSQNDLRDLSIVPGDTVTSSINVQTVSRIGATVYCGQSTGFRPMAMFEYRTSRNSNDRRRGSNVDNFSYGGGLMYSSPVIGEISAFVGKSEFKFPDADPILLASFPQVNVVSGGARFDRRLGARLQFNGQVTYAQVDVEGLRDNAFNGINWDIALSMRASDNLQITVGTARQIDASTGFRANFVRSEIYSADVDYAFTQRLRLGLSAAHQNRNFDTSSVIATPFSVTEDKFTRATARLRFQRFRRLGFSLFAGYEKRDASLDQYSYDGFSGGIGARLQL